MSQIVLHHTMPGSGTHLTRELLKTHPNVSYVKLNTGVSIAPLIPCLAQGLIDFTRFDRLINWVAHVQNGDEDRSRIGVFGLLKNAAPSILHDPLRESDLALAGKTVVLYSHIYLRGTGEDTGWDELPSAFHISDLLATGYITKTITPLRDPVQILCSVLARGHTPVVTRHGCRYLNDHPELYWHTFCVPVDLYACPEMDARRITAVRKLFGDFLHLPMEPATEAFVAEWPNINRMDRDHRIAQVPHEADWLNSVFDVVDALHAGTDPKGINPVVDLEIEQYKKFEGLKALYESYGYRNLCWF